MSNIKIIDNVKVFNDEVVIKKKGDKDLEYLFAYLKSKNFYHIPNIESKDEFYHFNYINDNSITDDDKYLELVRVVALLHQNTSYQKKISRDKYDSLYKYIDEYIAFYLNYFYEYLLLIETKEDNNMFELFFMNNYSFMINYFRDIKLILDDWYNKISDHDNERVSIIHNNLSLKHFIMGKEKILVSWDLYSIDSPLIDINKLIKNEYFKIDIDKVVREYLNNMELSIEEILLLKIIILLPMQIDFSNGNTLEKFKKLSFYLSYLKKASLIKSI